MIINLPEMPTKNNKKTSTKKYLNTFRRDNIVREKPTSGL